MQIRTRLLAILALSALGHPVRLAAQVVTELTVTPDTLRLAAGQRQGLSALAYDDAGNAVLDIRFRSSDTLVARVAPNGAVTAVSGGRARVHVEAGNRSAVVSVLVAGPTLVPGPTVRPVSLPEPSAAPAALPAITHLVAEPEQVSLLPSEQGRIQIRAIRADGSIGLPERLEWRSSRPDVVALSDSFGGITAMGVGQANIHAYIPGGPRVAVPVLVSPAEFEASQQRVVLSPDDSETLTLVVPRQGRRQLRPQDLAWSASDEGVLEVRPDGFVRARTAGRAEVIVRGFTQELRVPVVVHQRVARFAVAPRLTDTVRLPVDGTREFTLIPQTADSLPVDGVPITWTVADTTVAGFDPASGTLTARRPGRTTLQFSARGFVPKGWSIEVLAGLVALDRTRLGLGAGERGKLTASFVDSLGRQVAPGNGISWITSNAGVVRVGPDGTIEGVSPGQATITAQAQGGGVATATVFVAGDLLVTSTRSGRLGVYALLTRSPEQFLPLLADTAVNHLDATYSPDRTRIAYASDLFGQGNFDIFVADADGRNPVRLTTDPAMDLDPRWTPDGKTLVFVSARAGARQLYVMDLDGSHVRPLTALPGGAEEPMVSPDGGSVAFTGYPGRRDDPSDIFVVPMTGGEPRAVTTTRDRRESRPVYLPSGELAWVLHRKDKREPDQVLRQAPAGGGPSTMLVSNEHNLQDVALARDGSRIAWVASRAADRNSRALEFTLQWRPLPGGAETSVRLLPGERITSPTF